MNIYLQLRKCLVVGIILFFIGMSITPSIVQSSEKMFVLSSNGWMKTFGGLNEDWSWCVQQTMDGGFIITGGTWSFGAGQVDVWVIKTDSNGSKVWDKTFGGKNSDESYFIRETIDGGYIIVGGTESFGTGSIDVWLIKIDSSGNIIWDRTFGGEARDIGCCVQQTTDKGYIITGFTESFGIGGYDVWVIKTDDKGDEIWNKTFGGTSDEVGWCVEQTIDGSYIITGDTQSFGAGQNDAWLIKIDAYGNKMWDKILGGTSKDFGLYIQQTTTSDFIVTGFTSSFDVGGGDAWLIKTDDNGNEQWNKTFGGTDYDCGSCVQQTNDGGYILIGLTTSSLHSSDFWLIKTDGDGNIIWDRTFGGLGTDEGVSVQQTSDGGYILTGVTKSHGAGSYDIWLIKTDSQGKSKTTSGIRLKYETLFQKYLPMVSQYVQSYLNFPSKVPFLSNTPPQTSPVHWTAEWEKCTGVLLAWPLFWSQLDSIYSTMIDELQDVGNVYLLCKNALLRFVISLKLLTHNVPLDNITWLSIPYASIWTRDYGPLNIYNLETGEWGLVDNVYGHFRDDKVNNRLQRLWHTQYYETPIVVQGGNLCTDGLGKVFCLDGIMQENQPNLNENQLRQLFREYLNVEMIILPTPPISPHLDMCAKLVDPETWIVGQWSQNDPNTSYAEEIVSILSNMTASTGNPYTIYRIQQPPQRPDGLWSSYTNAYMENGKVLVPLYNVEQDTAALSVFQQALPDWEIIGIESIAFGDIGGAIHCSTHEIGGHNPLSKTFLGGES